MGRNVAFRGSPILIHTALLTSSQHFDVKIQTKQKRGDLTSAELIDLNAVGVSQPRQYQIDGDFEGSLQSADAPGDRALCTLVYVEIPSTAPGAI